MCFVIQGTPENWYHSLNDIENEGVLRPSRDCKEDCYRKLTEEKKRGRILWAFNDRETYERIEEALKKQNSIPVIGVSTKSKGGDRFRRRSIVVIGKISKEDLIGRCECNYWPQGDKWDYKFFIEVDLWLEERLYDNGIEFPVFQGSISEIDCRLVAKIGELAAALGYRAMRRTVPTTCVLKIDSSVITKLGEELFANTIDLGFLIRSVANGNVLLAGPPGVGKTKAARALAEALGAEPIHATAHALWFRRDVIGGESIGPAGVYWRSGLLIKAYNKAAESVLAGVNKPVFLILDEVNRADVDKAFAEFFTIFPTPFCRDWAIPSSLIDEIRSYREKDDDAKKFIEYYGQLGDVPLRLIRVVATMNVRDWRNLFLTGEAFLRRFIVVKANCTKDYGYIDKISDVREEVRKAMLEYLKMRQDCVPPAAVLGALMLLNLKDGELYEEDIEAAINAVLGSRKYLLGHGGGSKA